MQWTSVEESLPGDEVVIVAARLKRTSLSRTTAEETRVEFGHYSPKHGWTIFNQPRKCLGVTHWMPLPALPEA